MLYEPPKTKQYILIGFAVLFLAVLVFVFWSVQKRKTNQADMPTVQMPSNPAQEAKNSEDIVKALNEENVPVKSDDPAIQEENIQVREEILDAIKEENPKVEAMPSEKIDPKAQELIDAMTVNNKKK